MSAELERRTFAAQLPVHWWDQPRLEESTPEPFQHLLSAAVEELERLYSGNAGPVGILASSFGARLALGLMREAPRKIASVSIVGGTLDLRAAIVRLGRRVAAATADPSLAKLSDAVASGSREGATVWPLVERLLSVANLLEFLWGPGANAQRRAMQELAAQGRLLHLPTYQCVLRDSRVLRAADTAIEWRGPVTVWIGRHDPYALLEDEAAWRTVLPSVVVKWGDCGHFPHLEMPSALWMPSFRSLHHPYG